MTMNESWQPQPYFVIKSNYALDRRYQEEIVQVLRDSRLYSESLKTAFDPKDDLKETLYYAALDCVAIEGRNPNFLYLKSIRGYIFPTIEDLLQLLACLEPYTAQGMPSLELGTPAVIGLGIGIEITEYNFVGEGHIIKQPMQSCKDGLYTQIDFSHFLKLQREN